jgi:hypothetical protein
MIKVDPELADDLLRGVDRISQFINEDRRATYYKLVTGKLPGGKEGAQWVASKGELRKHYAKLTAGKAA